MPLVESEREPDSATAPLVDPVVARAYWKKTSALMWTMLVVWAVASFFVHLLAPAINHIHVLGFPLGFYFAAQGSLIVFVVMLFWFAARQNRIDEEFGVQED